jgi:glycosyltransferase involved in cell wall biosynthesis
VQGAPAIKKKLRVTHLTPSGEIGGAESVILDCIGVGDGWPGAETSVVTLSAGPFVAAVERLGATARVVETPATLGAVGDSFASRASVVRSLVTAVWTFPAFFRRFSAAVAAMLPQLIHSHGIKTHVLGALLPRHAPVVWHLHDYLGSRSVSSRLMSLLARRCTLAIAVSESVARDARLCLPARLPLVVVHNSVDCDRYRPDGPALDLDALSGLPAAPAGTVRVGLPATFARWKGHDTFLEAIALLGSPVVRAYVIGAPVYRTRHSQWSQAELLASVTTLGLDGRVGFTGLVRDMPAAYRALDVVVHASTRPEPFGLVIAEAMACGRALVAAPTGGAAELFVDGEHAIAAASGDAASLASALARLVSDPAERASLGRRARAHVVASFGRERFAENLRVALSQAAVATGAAR